MSHPITGNNSLIGYFIRCISYVHSNFGGLIINLGGTSGQIECTNSHIGASTKRNGCASSRIGYSIRRITDSASCIGGISIHIGAGSSGTGF
ncbi:hypothetical protein Q5H93_21255 [Hymenobacter sp. ASUV-10]|uniref:Uncharacterized protein n=1 Tax=Hymenobacter aranciens TaxID=3063996 RepID=A0ABT9BKV2_9BACT|nr:hypothetical protein [Hymenobacter sp. ASUV-10]MDO7877286.1 hypothetical protein [Hymenobacter sp. ASUV-10]